MKNFKENLIPQFVAALSEIDKEIQQVVSPNTEPDNTVFNLLVNVNAIVECKLRFSGVETKMLGDAILIHFPKEKGLFKGVMQ